MNTLSIYTSYPDVVADILLKEQMIERDQVMGKLDFLLRIKPDGLNQSSLKYWLGTAQTIGLVTSYVLDRGGRA